MLGYASYHKRALEADMRWDLEGEAANRENRQEVVAASLSRQGAVAAVPRLRDCNVAISRSDLDGFRRLSKWRQPEQIRTSSTASPIGGVPIRSGQVPPPSHREKDVFSTERTQPSIANKGLSILKG